MVAMYACIQNRVCKFVQVLIFQMDFFFLLRGIPYYKFIISFFFFFFPSPTFLIMCSSSSLKWTKREGEWGRVLFAFAWFIRN